MKLKIDRLITEGAFVCAPMRWDAKGTTFEYTLSFELIGEGKGHGWVAPLPGFDLRQTIKLSYDPERRALVAHFGPQQGRGGLLAMVAELYRYREKYGRLE